MPINRKYRNILVSLLLSGATSISMFGARPTVKMSIDSSQILMGYTTGLRFAVTPGDSGDNGQLILRPDSAALKSNAGGGVMELTPGVEVVEGYQTPLLTKTAQSGSDAMLHYEVKIQSFDSGNYIIPPVMYVNGHDTVLSNSVALRVYPIDTITANSDIMAMSGLQPPYERKFVDYLPDWLVDNWIYILIGFLILVGGVCAYMLLTRKVNIRILPQKKPEPPYNVAMAKLEQLREEKLCEHGLQKEYYTRLTDILREYLDRRFNINAMEMTSTQIRRALDNSKDEIMSKELVEHVLETADFVKFAKAQPLGDDNIKAFEFARKFVEDTKPADPAVDNNTDAGGNGDPNGNSNNSNGSDSGNVGNDSNAGNVSFADTVKEGNGSGNSGQGN